MSEVIYFRLITQLDGEQVPGCQLNTVKRFK